MPSVANRMTGATSGGSGRKKFSPFLVQRSTALWNSEFSKVSRWLVSDIAVVEMQVVVDRKG